MFKSLEKKYFDIPLSRGFVSLYTGRTISLISGALLGLFLPIFLYNLFDQNFQAVVVYYTIGFFLFGITIAFGAGFLNKFGFRRALQLVMGKVIDGKVSKKKVLKWGTLFYSLGWVIKIFVSTAFQIFIAGAYHSAAYILLRTPFDTLTYEIAADQGHYIDEFTVLREMALQLGRLIMAILIIIISLFFAIQWIFALAAFASIIFNLLEQREVRLGM